MPLVNKCLSSALGAGFILFTIWGCEQPPIRTIRPQSQSEYGEVENFALLDHLGRFHELYYYSDARAIVLFIQGNGCPIVRNTIPALKQIEKDFRDRNIVFLMLNANLQDNRTNIAQEAREFGVTIPILIDETQLIAESLNLTRTAEVLVIEPKGWQIVYRGPVDDRLGYETQRQAAARHFLIEALNDLLAGQPIKVEESISLTHWIEAGSEKGEAPDPLLDDPPAPSAEWPLGEPDLILEGSPQRIPATGIVDYRYTSVKVLLEKGVWISAAHLKPSNPRVLHHALAFVPDEKKDEPQGFFRKVYERARWLKRRFTKGGRSSASLIDPAELFHGNPWYETIFTKYNPGMTGEVFPEGTGRFLPAGSHIVLQLHYTTTGREETDNPRLGLYLSDKPPEHELKITAAINQEFSIPPGAKHHEVSADYLFERDVILYKMQSHMHYRGRQMSFEATFPNGRKELFLSIPHYQFNWQKLYELEEPRFLPAGTRIRYRGSFDNSIQNPANPDPSKWVKWGLQSSDEMFIGYLVYREVDLESGGAGNRQ